MDRRKKLMSKKIPFGNENAKLKRVESCEARRRIQREKNIAKYRVIENDESEDKEEQTEDAVNSRMAKLKKWKAEKARQKQLEALNKKPVFKIGVPHHSFYSPATKDEKHHCHRKRGNETLSEHRPTKISRVTERRLAAKAEKKQTTVEAGKTPIARRTRARQKLALKTTDESVKQPTGINVTAPLFGFIPIPNEPDTPKDVKHFFNFQYNIKSTVDKKTSNRKSAVTDSNRIDNTVEIKNNNEQSRESSIESVVQHMSSQDNLSDEINSKDEILPSFEEKISGMHPKCASPVAAQFSPFIVTSRGKSSARKEMKKRMSVRKSCSPVDTDIPTKDTVMEKLNISVDEEEKTAQYYGALSNREEKRLKELCDEWNKVLEESEIPENGVDHINAAIGHSVLLIRKKFGRFQQLVADCETGKGEMLVRCRDLQGFWELVSREIKDCDSRFLKLYDLKSNNWVEEEPEIMPVVKPIKKSTAVTKKKKLPGRSHIAAFIEAQRMKKLADQKNMQIKENDEDSEENQIEPIKFQNLRKTLLKSSVSSCDTPKSLKNSNLLKRVQLSESAKKLALATIKINQNCKTPETPEAPEITLDQSISYINSNQTPGKGILKRSEQTNETRPPKSAYKVNFNEAVTMNIGSDKDLLDINFEPAVDLQRISPISMNSYSGSEENNLNPKINKKLNFEDTSFLDDEDQSHSVRSVIKSPENSDDSLTVKQTPKKTSQRKSIDILSSISQDENQAASISMQNSFSIPVIKLIDATPSKNRVVDIVPEDIDNRKSLRRSSRRNSNVSGGKENDYVHRTRRSTRISMKSIGDSECSGCSVTFPPSPMTPRRRKKLNI